jgi:lipopolysaccharide transport system permease protein
VSTTSEPVVVIKPSTGWLSLQLRDIWEYRELLFFLTWRDIKIRYKQTILGAAWAVIQPVMLMVVFTLFIGRVTNIKYSVPYPVVVYSGLLPWTLFASSLGASSESLISGSNLVSKIYFPRLILPIAAGGSFLADFVIASTVLGGLMVYYGIEPNGAIVLIPVFALFTFMTAVAFGIWLTALNVRYRDVHYIVPFAIQLGLFASPVAYQATAIPSAWRWAYDLNPMVGVIDGFRWALIGGARPPAAILISFAVVIVVLFSGMAYFRRMERTFADVV